MSFTSRLGKSVMGGVKAVGHAHASVASTVADGVGSAYSAVVDAKGDPSSRCFVMTKEASTFSATLQRAEKELKGLVAAAEVALEGGKAALESARPHVYEETAAGGGGKPFESIAGAAGAGAGAGLAKAKLELAQKVQTDMLQPLQQWQARFKDAEAKQKAVNKLFGEQEAARKKVEAQRAKVDELRGKQSAADPKSAAKYEEATKQLAQLESALAVSISRHTQEEAEQYAKLVPLVREAPALQSWLKAAFSAVAAAFAAAVDAVPAADPNIQGLSLT